MYNYSELNGTIGLVGPFSIAIHDIHEINMLEETCTVKIVLSVIMVISMVFSVIGNICTCTIIIRDRTMRTPTNYYLANIAFTDFFMSLFIPIEIYIIWIPDFYPLGEVGCRLHFILLDILSICNLLTITAFTIERYIVVKKPFLRQKMLKNSRVFKIVGVIWMVSLCVCLPDIFFIEFMERKKYVFCYYSITYLPSILIGIELFVLCIIPMTIIIVLYGLIVLALKSANNKMQSSPINVKQNRDKAVKILAAVAASYFFFWTPYCVLRVLMIYPNFNYDDNQSVWKILNYLCYNSYLATCVNPVIYNLTSKKFRKAFKNLLRGRRILRRNEMKTSTAKQGTLDTAIF